MVKQLVIAQLNARRSVAVLDLVAQVLVQEKIDILLLQEPPLALEPKLWTLAGYRIYLACGEHPLTAVLVHSFVHYISGFFGGSSVWGSHPNKHWGTGGFFFLYPTDDRGRAGPTLARVGYGHRTYSA